MGSSEGHLGTSLGGSFLGSILVNSGQFWTLSWTQSEKPHLKTKNCLHLAVGRAFGPVYTRI